MYYIAHLAAPLILALIEMIAGVARCSASIDIGSGLQLLAHSYVAFAAPHWIWAALSSYFDADRRTTIGGFIGAHVLLIAVGVWVFSSTSREAANGWLLYLLGAPFAVFIGATAGAKIGVQGKKDAP